MAGAGRRKGRLVQLAREAGFEPVNPTVTLQQSSRTTTQQADRDYVNNILLQNRAAKFASEDHCLRRSPSKAPFTHEEKSAAFQTLFEKDASAGQAQALLEMGADVNIARHKSTSLLKRLKNKDQVQQRSDVLDASLQWGRLENFRVLVSAADQQNLDKVLGGVLSRKRDIELPFLELLLSHGANVNLYPNEFQSLVKDGRKSFVYLLSSGTVPPSSSLATQSLSDAVGNGDLTTVALLLWHGADADSNSSMALIQAISTSRLDIVAALCLAKSHPSASNLSVAVLGVCDDPQFTENVRLRLLEILLSAGAQGPQTEDALSQATRSNKYDLVSLLVEYGDSPASNASENIKMAMTKGDIKLFSTFMTARSTAAVMNIALAHIWTIRSVVSRTIWIQMFEDIVSKGPSQDALGMAVVEAARLHDTEAADRLVNSGASTNFMDGKALAGAVLDLRLDLTKILLRGNPETTVMAHAFSKLNTAKTSEHLRLARLLLDAGARGDDVDEVLRDTVNCMIHDNNTYNFISIMVRGGANVNVADGECFSIAAGRNEVRVLKSLLEGQHNAASTGRGVAAARNISAISDRYYVMNLLLSNGAMGTHVDDTLAAVVDSSESLSFVELFLLKGHPNLNYGNGEAVLRSVKNHNIPVLQALLGHGPSNDTLSRALTEAMAIGDQNRRLEICRMLLEAGVTGRAVDQALVDAIDMKPPDKSLLQALLAQNASLDYDEGRALRICIRRTHIQLLEMFLTKSIMTSILRRSFEVVMAVKEQTKQLQCLELFLRKGQQELLTELNRFLPATFETSDDLRALDMFLQNGASVDDSSARALQKAVALGNIAALQLLLAHSPSNHSLNTIFEAAWSGPNGTRLQSLEAILNVSHQNGAIHVSYWLEQAIQENPISKDLIALLLFREASVHYNHNAVLRRVVARSQPDVLAQLLEKKASTKSIADVFDYATTEIADWLAPGNVKCLDLLLDHGACGEPIDKALLQCVRDYHMCPQNFLDHLIHSGASVEYQAGLALIVATRKSDAILLEKLFRTNPPKEIVETAFPEILQHGTNEDEIMKVMGVYFQHEPALDLLINQSGFDLILFEALKSWGTSTLIVNELLEKGADVNGCKMLRSLDGHAQEEVSVLMWTICSNHEAQISDQVIETLLQYRPNVDFTSSVFGTPLTASVKQSRATLVELLIEHGADASLCDSTNRSPLFYASCRGDSQSMTALIEAQAQCNDGSIQEAARKCNAQAIRHLLDAGHDPNFPSPLHKERGALSELITQFDDPRISIENMALAISELVMGGAKRKLQVEGKSLLLQALDSPHPRHTTTALLNAFMGEFINDEFNLFRHDGYVYSPLYYVLKNQQKSAVSQAPALVRILETGECKSVYYRLQGPQPEDYIGAPDAIRAAEEQGQARLLQIQQEKEDHERRLDQSKELEAEEQQRLQRSHTLHLTQERERNTARDRARSDSAALELQIQRDRQLDQEKFDEHRRDNELTHQRSMRQIDMDATQAQNREQLDFKRKLMIEDKKSNDDKIAAEQQTASIRRGVLQLEAQNLEQQTKLLDKQKSVMQLMGQAQNGAGGRNRHEIGWIEEE